VDASVVGGRSWGDEPGALSPLHEAGHRVGLQLELFRQPGDARRDAVRRASDRDEQLMLRGGDADLPSRLVSSPGVEPQGLTEPSERFVLLI
jgi:hypothetical protein